MLALLLWSLQGFLEPVILRMEQQQTQPGRKARKKQKTPSLQTLPWHNLVEHVPALHHQLGSLYELLSIEHEGEHGHCPLVLYGDTHCNHSSTNILNDMCGTPPPHILMDLGNLP